MTSRDAAGLWQASAPMISAITTSSQEVVTYAAPSIEIEAMHGTGGTTGEADDTGTTGE